MPIFSDFTVIALNLLYKIILFFIQTIIILQIIALIFLVSVAFSGSQSWSLVSLWKGAVYFPWNFICGNLWSWGQFLQRAFSSLSCKSIQKLTVLILREDFFHPYNAKSKIAIFLAVNFCVKELFIKARPYLENLTLHEHTQGVGS